MRSLVFGGASALALLVPAQALAQTGGYVDLSAGQTSVDGTDLDVISIGGAVATDISDTWGVQFDADTSRYSQDGALTVTNATAHAFYKGDTWAVGGVVSNRDLLVGSIWSMGVEGQTYIGPVVLEGEVGVGTLETFGGDAGTTNANVSGTFYVTDDFSIGAGMNYLNVDDFFGDAKTYNITAEYKFSGTPWSVFADYSNTDFSDFNADMDGFQIGVRFAFGDDTLKGRRHTGPRWQRDSSIGILPAFSL